MNICFLCQNLYRDQGGTEIYTLETAKALARNGHTVHIVAENCGEMLQNDLGENIHVHLVDFNERPFLGYWKLDRIFPLSDLRYSMAAAKKIKGILKCHSIDIIESTDYFRQGFWYGLFKPIPFFMRLHGWFFNRSEGRENPVKSLNFRERFLWRMQKISIDCADGISAVATDFRDFAQEIWNCQNRSIHVIHNGVDTSVFHPAKAIARERSVLFVGRMVKNKGIMVLAQAIPKILSEHPAIHFYFAGKNMFINEAEMTAQEYILKYAPKENVHFLGEIRQEELVGLYRKCLICAMPSFYEAFSIAALEAMGCGCAMVATDVGGFKDMIRHGEDGFLVPPGDPDALAEAVKNYLRDDILREQCSENAAAKISDHFNYDRLVEKTIVAYTQAIENFRNDKENLCPKSA